MAAHPSQCAWDSGFSPGGLQLNHSRHVGSVPSKFHLCQWFVIFCDGIVPECFKGSTSIWSRNKPPHTGKDFAVRSFHCWIVRIGVSPYDEGVHLSFFSGTAVDKTKRPLSQSQLFGPRSREKGFSPRGCQRGVQGVGVIQIQGAGLQTLGAGVPQIFGVPACMCGGSSPHHSKEAEWS
jgi:hypothetical protein